MVAGDWPWVVKAATMVMAITTRRNGLVFMMWSLEERREEGKTVGSGSVGWLHFGIGGGGAGMMRRK